MDCDFCTGNGESACLTCLGEGNCDGSHCSECHGSGIAECKRCNGSGAMEEGGLYAWNQ